MFFLLKRAPSVSPLHPHVRLVTTSQKKKLKEAKATVALHLEASKIKKKENLLAGVVKNTMTRQEKYLALRKVCCVFGCHSIAGAPFPYRWPEETSSSNDEQTSERNWKTTPLCEKVCRLPTLVTV